MIGDFQLYTTCSSLILKSEQTSGAINSALPTGLAKSGSLLTLVSRGGDGGLALLARSRSHSFTGLTRSISEHSTFSGFTSRCAIPIIGIKL